jgi:hypothetical protein
MKAKVLIIALAVLLCFSSFTSLAKCEEPAVKVAVYIESANIDSSERAKIVDAMGVVESRFENNIGYKVDLEIVGSWTSRKDVKEVGALLSEAISETDGTRTSFCDNYGEYVWKFHKDGYTAAIYFVEQDLEDEGVPINGGAHPILRAGMVDYNAHGYSKPFERLCSVTQHELSHLFGITIDNCGEEWCVMNYDYMPYETGFWFIVWWIKTGEEWATDWGPECKQRLIQTYNGIVERGSSLDIIYISYDGFAFRKITYVAEWQRWNLTSFRAKTVFSIGIPIIWYVPSSGAAHPTFNMLMQGSLTVIES